MHGGAGGGRSLRGHEPECRAALVSALEAARAVLEAGGDAIDAVQRAVEVLEACELFNAGRGAALCADGSAELSAAVMRGSDRAAGAVAAIHRTKHPVAAAAALLDRAEVLMVGDPADELAARSGAEQVANAYFVTERQRRALPGGRDVDRHGTVGAVCLDVRGSLAAATSTGGIAGQPPGRVGDSPLIGAGTWADALVAVSCTGDGEAFIRAGAARQVAEMARDGAVLAHACAAALGDVAGLGGSGGMIALDVRGQVSLPFRTEVMPRGIWRAAGEPAVWIAAT